jgi:hypothetical protein
MKLSEIMRRSTFIRGSSKVIFSINYSDIEALEEMLDIDRYVQTIIQKMPKKSMLLLLDTRKLSVSSAIREHLKEVFVRYGSYFRSSAVVVDEGNESIIRGLAKELGFTKMAIFPDLESARERLLGDDRPLVPTSY